MKILAIGGSYFLGRVFVMLAGECHEVTAVNRGNQPLTGMNVREIRGERHDAFLWKQFAEEFDVIVDFCAYQEGDIRTVVENFAGSVRQYVFVSTVDVYVHGQQGCRDRAGQFLRTEDAVYETVRYPGREGEYIAGKVALERELQEVCAVHGIRTTVFRPAFIYGPLNYTPRETLFIQLMARDGILPVITGANGKFQFLYVKDGAEAILKCLLNEDAYGQAYNLCGDEIIDYAVLAAALKRGAEEVKASRMKESAATQDAREEPGTLEEVEITAAQAESRGFPLPFPVTEAESMLCSNEKSKRELGMTYTPLEEGMIKTCRAFWDVLR